MKRHGSFIRKNVFEFDWNEFPDEALQYDTWNLSFDDEEEASSGATFNVEAKQENDPDSLED